MAGQLRTVLTNPVVKIAAREITCYFQIRHDQVQRLAIEHLERLAAISDCVDGSKAFTQDFAFQVQDRIFLVYQQNAALPSQPVLHNRSLIVAARDRR